MKEPPRAAPNRPRPGDLATPGRTGYIRHLTGNIHHDLVPPMTLARVLDGLRKL